MGMSFSIISIFRRPHYQSDVTLFIDKLKTDKPSLESEQRAGRALLWDKQVDRAAWSDYRAGEVEQKPYVYQTDAK
jgi:Protein of unknown function (DUF3460)